MVEQAGCQGEKVGVGDVAIWLLINTDEQLLNLQLDAYMQKMHRLQMYAACNAAVW